MNALATRAQPKSAKNESRLQSEQLVPPIVEVRDRSAEFKRITTPTDLLALVVAASLAALAVKRLLD